MRLLTTLLLALLVATGVAGAQELILNNAQIVDPAARKIIQGTIVIREGKIAEILAGPPSGSDANSVDLQGKWVIPGLNDMHVHSFGNIAPGNNLQMMGTPEVARVMLFSGVTGFLDLFMAEDAILAERDAQRSQGMLGADIYCAGPIFTVAGGHGTEYGVPTRTVANPAEAERQIDELAAKNPDVIKISYDHAYSMMPSIDRPTMEALVREATRRGLKTVVHIGTWTDAREAVEAGATCITHVHMEEDIPDDLVALMRQRGVYEIPTLAVQNDLANIIRDPKLLASPLLMEIAAPAIVGAYGDTSKLDARLKGWYRMQLAGEASLFRSVKKMIDGGVKVLAGTDAGNPGTFQGYSLHRELELLVKAGMTPWDALAAATTRAGELLGRDFGIRPGAVANLVVLDASPVEDIRNTQKVAGVIYHGAMVDRAKLLKPDPVVWKQGMLDDFASAEHATSGGEWSITLDSLWGGKSTLNREYKKGSLRVWGKVVPAKGSPGMAGISLGFGKNIYDVTGYDGVRLRIKATRGPLALKLITAGVKNFDHHGIMIENKPGMQQLEIPFSKFTQLWSAPMPWTGKDMQGVAFLVSTFGTSAEYDFTIDSIELYKAKR